MEPAFLRGIINLCGAFDAVPDLLTFAVIVALWAEAGRRTFQVVMLVSGPDPAVRALAQGIAEGELWAWAAKARFIVFWPLIMSAGWVIARLEALRKPEDRP